MYLTLDGSGMHISRDIGSTECYGGLMRVMHAAARAALEREAHALKRGPSSPRLNRTVEESTMNFDQPETWSKRVKESVERVNEMAWQRMRVWSRGDRGWVRTAIARTIASAIATVVKPQTSDMKREKSPDLEGSGAHISQTRSTCHN